MLPKFRPYSRNIPHSIFLLFIFFILLETVGSANGSVYTTYNASDYNIINGTYLSGSVPKSIQAVDSDYLTIRSEESAITTLPYNPSSYNLLGGTTLVSGTTGNVALSDETYMSFRSYFSGIDTEDYVDNNTSDVDSSPDKGTHSGFSAQQTGPDSTYDTLTEENTDTIGFAMEWGTVSVNDTFQTVSLINTYTSSIIVCVPSYTSGVPRTVRLRDINSTSFKVRVQNPSGTTSPSTTVHYVVVEEGVWTTPLKMEASKYDTNTVGEDNNWAYDTRSYGQTYSGSLIVLHQVMTYNDAGWITTYVSKSDSRTSPPSSADSSFRIALNGAEAIDTHGIETIGYIIVEQGFGTLSGIKYDAKQTTDSIQGFDNAPPYNTTFSQSFSGTPEVIISAQLEMSGPNGGWVVDHTITQTQAGLMIDEDQVLDLERSHTTETCGFWAFETAGSYSTTNYELDLEVQWTNLDYDEISEYLCIYVGNMGSENLNVDYWSSSGWNKLFTDLTANSWNNVSISLTNSTFTIRFKGSSETFDTTQDTWQIDAILLHVWSNEYTTKVELTGTSNTYNWTYLNWTVDSSWTIDAVSVTLQLYNYTAGKYPTSGYGYISYSSGTANNDEKYEQTITTNPSDFRNETGEWKIKIKGVKNTATQFDFKADWVEFKPTHYEYTASAEFTFSGMTTNSPIKLNFRVVSQYNISSVNVTVQIWNYSASTYATSGESYLTYTSIGSNENKTLRINTNPQFYTLNGNAKIKVTGVLATPTQFQQEINQVKLLYSYDMQSSSQPFDWFTTLLYVLPLVFVTLFLLALKLKRKKKTINLKPPQPPEGSLGKSKPKKPHIAKKTDAFSQQFGMTHQQMIGRKMLLEIDPTSNYNQALSSFVSEAKNSDESLFILTNKNSTLHSAFSGANNVKFLLLTSKTSTPQQINEKETLLPASDLSVLLNAFVRIQKVETKKTINVLFDNLSDIILRCGFEKTYKFIGFLLEAISSRKTTALFVFNPTAHNQAILSAIRGLFQNQLAYAKSGPKTGTL